MKITLYKLILTFFVSTHIYDTCYAVEFSKKIVLNNIKYVRHISKTVQQEPVVSPNGKHIVYVAKKDSRLNTRRIWIMDIDGKNERLLVDDKQSHMQFYPQWSADGNMIAYISNLGGDTSVWVAAIDGRDPKKISRNDLGLHPVECLATWSPDGKSILVNGKQNGKFQILLLSIDGVGSEVLYESTNVIKYPSFSPNGKKIVFSGTNHDSGNMWIFTTDDGGLSPLNSTGRNGIYCDWSPDGNWLAFQSHEKNSLFANVYIMPSIGGKPILVSDSTLVSAARTVSWGVDGKTLYYTGHPVLNESYLAVVDTTGENFSVLTEINKKKYNFISSNIGPSWSPNQKALAFTSSYEDSVISLFSLLNNKSKYLTIGISPDFSPEGNEISFIRGDKIWITDINDVDPYPLTLRVDEGVSNSQWSPDGEWLSLISNGFLWKVSAYGGPLVPLLEGNIQSWPIGWFHDSQIFYFIASESLRTKKLDKRKAANEGFGSIMSVRTDVSPGIANYITDNIGFQTPDISSNGLFFTNGSMDADFGLQIHYLNSLDSFKNKKMTFPKYPDHAVTNTSISPTNDRIAFILTPEWSANTWTADISEVINPTSVLP